MKKFLFLSILVGLTFTGCTNDDLLGGEQKNGGNKDAIGFMYQTKNMTRAEKLQNTHYEFGVFTYNPAGVVMNNYLVGYADADLYNTLFAGATTYGDPTSQVDGLSYWFYESLGKTAGTYVHTPYNTPDLDQDLKYWDKSQSYYKFWAYAPYTNTTEGTVAKQNALKVAFDGSDALTFTSLSSFYTNPQSQIVTADVEAADANATKYNEEMINYNEGLYAYQEYDVEDYGTDVPLNFEHINAKVNVKFYSDIKGYTVKIIDAVPETLPGTSTYGTKTVTAPTAANGIQFSPATTLQSWVKMNEKQPVLAALPTYYENANVKVSAMSTTPTIAVSKNDTYDPVNKNLIFQEPTTVIGTTKASATASPTTLYVLPNVAGTTPAYITDSQSEAWRSESTSEAPSISTLSSTWGGATTTVADSTGYTLHLSYELIPNDGSATITMYDARVFVPAKNCQWEAGKAYTYIFKITKNSNGVTNPLNAIDPYTKDETNPDPYVDVTDPRVNDEAGLQPIVFDGVTVTDYVDGAETEYVISETTLDWSIENAFNNIKELFSAGGSQTGAAIYNGKTGGDGSTKTNAYVFTLNTVTSDYIDYTTGTVTNQCNVFNDVQAMVQALYNEEGIEKIEYPEGTVYTRGEALTDHGQKIRTFYLNGNTGTGRVRLESAIANEILTSPNNPYNTFNATSSEIKVISANKANPDAPIYIKVAVKNTANEVASATALKTKVMTYNTKSAGDMTITGSDGVYTITLNAVDADVMWPGYPATTGTYGGVAINANNNNVYKDIRGIFDDMFPPFTTATYDVNSYDAEGLANAIVGAMYSDARTAIEGAPATTTIPAGVVDFLDNAGKTIHVTLVLNLTVK